MFSERSGVVNIGLEGMMLMGAFFGAWGADKTDGWVGGLAIGILAGALLALVHAYFSIHLRTDQIISGTAIDFLAFGITGYIFNDICGSGGISGGGVPPFRASRRTPSTSSAASLRRRSARFSTTHSATSAC